MPSILIQALFVQQEWKGLRNCMFGLLKSCIIGNSLLKSLSEEGESLPFFVPVFGLVHWWLWNGMDHVLLRSQGRQPHETLSTGNRQPHQGSGDARNLQMGTILERRFHKDRNLSQSIYRDASTSRHHRISLNHERRHSNCPDSSHHD